jgi:hypothetical protein
MRNPLGDDKNGMVPHYAVGRTIGQLVHLTVQSVAILIVGGRWPQVSDGVL